MTRRQAQGEAPPPTERQVSLSNLAAALAAADVDAAEYLAQVLATEARERKRVKGFGIEIRVNSVTGRGEIRGPMDR